MFPFVSGITNLIGTVVAELSPRRKLAAVRVYVLAEDPSRTRHSLVGDGERVRLANGSEERRRSNDRSL